MFRIISISAFAAVLSVPLVASPALSAGPAPIGPDDESAGPTVPLEVVHVETDTNFDDTSTQGTVLFAETMAPTASAQPGWWLRMDVTVRNIGDQPIEITEVGITTETSALDVESLEDPISVAPGGTALIKPHDVTGSGTAPTWFTVNFYAPGSAPFPAQGTYPLETYDNATATGGFRFPARAEDLPAGVFWTPGGFHAHSRGQRYAYDLKAIRWDHDREEWTKYTEQAFDDAANGITLGSKNEHHLIWGQPVYAMANGWSVSCRRSEPDHQPGQANSVPGANVISIDHGNGEIAAYAHLMQNTLPANLCAAEAPVDDDDAPVAHEPVYIQEGEYLGLVGNSGPSTGPHLHLHLSDGGSGLPLNFYDVFVHTYDGFDPTIDQPDWNWVTSGEAAAVGYAQLIHPNSCGWDAPDEIGGYTTGGRNAPTRPRDCDEQPDPLAVSDDGPVVAHGGPDDVTPRPRPSAS